MKKLTAHYNPNRQGLELFHIEYRYPGPERFYAAPVEMVPYKNGEMIKPFLLIKDEDQAMLQELMDTLWTWGLRPSRNRHIEEILTAKDDHLKDLRKVAFHALGLKNETS